MSTWLWAIKVDAREYGAIGACAVYVRRVSTRSRVCGSRRVAGARSMGRTRRRAIGVGVLTGMRIGRSRLPQAAFSVVYTCLLAS